MSRALQPTSLRLRRARRGAGDQERRAPPPPRRCGCCRRDHRLALTGTPVENHLGELWSLFEFLNPGLLGRRRAVRRPRAVDGGSADRDQLERAGARAAAVHPAAHQGSGGARSCRRAPKRRCTASSRRQQRALYDELRDHYRRSLLEQDRSRGARRDQDSQILEALLRLRQAACHPGLLDKARRPTTPSREARRAAAAARRS